jgi:hypothetical protein
MPQTTILRDHLPAQPQPLWGSLALIPNESPAILLVKLEPEQRVWLSVLFACRIRHWL